MAFGTTQTDIRFDFYIPSKLHLLFLVNCAVEVRKASAIPESKLTNPIVHRVSFLQALMIDRASSASIGQITYGR